MTEKIVNGGPAFPFADTDPSNVPMQAQGMSLREWFAGQALVGLLCGPYRDNTRELFTRLPGEALCIADAMIAARKGGSQ